MNPPLGRDWIATHLPHQADMSLLDEIVKWDATTVHALARRHRSPDHPLRRAGELPITAGIEYGAQAAAVHGALAGDIEQGNGLLVSARSVAFHVRRLDDIDSVLEIFAEQLAGGESGMLYRFEVRAAHRCLVEGRISVAFPR